MEDKFPISPSTYEWSVRLFGRLKKILGVNIRLHEHETPLAEGDIFLFNHFARFETFIPQYFIYEQTGAYCRSIAAAEFFEGDDTLANIMVKVGAVPHNHPHLLPFLAREILRGRKVVLFPEGGMVKDRSVVDEKGHYKIYSRTADLHRKHHTGAALLAMALERFKTRIRIAAANGNQKQLETWRESLNLDSIEDLLKTANKPTNIIPANITFYPIHVDDNILRRGIEIFNKKKLSQRASEEILIESNLILKNTDMDIRLGKAISPDDVMHWWNRSFNSMIQKRSTLMEDYFHLSPIKNRYTQKIIEKLERHCVGQLRDIYMERMYSRVTINLSHLASVVIYQLIDKDVTSIEEDEFFQILYLCIKNAQQIEDVFLHRRLLDSTYYEKVLDGKSSGLSKFLQASISTGLIKHEWSRFIFTEKLCSQHDIDQIRLQNVVAVYANEARPVATIAKAVGTAIKQAAKINPVEWAKLRFDDEIVRYNWYQKYYDKPRFKKINDQQTATMSGEPYIILPDQPSQTGVILVHGLLSSPAELKTFGERLAAKGYPVIGTRMAGHGTSPWDLKQREFPDWVESVYRSYEIMSAYCDQICLIGFSTGAAASLLFAADNPSKVAGVAAVSTPIKFSDKNIVFVPFLHGLSKLLKLVRSEETLNPFRLNNSLHPEINYRHLPIKTLYELRLMVENLKQRLPEVTQPCLIMQAKHDTIVDPSSATFIENNIGSSRVSKIMVPSDRHGLILEDIADCQTHLMSFLTGLQKKNRLADHHATNKDRSYTDRRVTSDIR